MLQVALPNKGTLSEEAVRLVREAGYRCRRYARELRALDGENGVEFFFLRPRDIAVYVSRGILDMGITGRDLAADSRSEVTERMALGFGKSTFRYAVPRESGLRPEGFAGRRIATSYPNLVGDDLKRRGVRAEVVRLDGAVEIAVDLGVADAVADVVQSGRTMQQAGLVPVGEPIMRSEAVLTAREDREIDQPAAVLFMKRLRGIVVAREYVMVEYDISEAFMEVACMVTPGIESPTVAPLSRKGWVAVKAMARKPDLNGIMDRLAEIGARGIIVTDIRTCRI